MASPTPASGLSATPRSYRGMQMEALLDDAARTAQRAFREELCRVWRKQNAGIGVPVPVSLVGPRGESAAIVIMGAALHQDFRASHSHLVTDDLARDALRLSLALELHGIDADFPLDLPPEIGAGLTAGSWWARHWPLVPMRHPPFVVGGVLVQVLTLAWP